MTTTCLNTCVWTPRKWISLKWVNKIKHYSRHDIHYFTACALLYGSNTRTQRKPRPILHLAVAKDWLALWRHANTSHYHCYANLADCSCAGKLAKSWYQLISPWPDPICLVSFLGCKRNRGVCNAYLYRLPKSFQPVRGYMRFNEKSFCFRWQETTKLMLFGNIKTSSLVILCDLRYLMGNISSVMIKHSGCTT